MSSILNLVYVLLSYFVGSIPVGVILTNMIGGEDIRKAGSGNIGATNVYRVHGKKLGALTLLGDMLKGLLPTLIAQKAGASALLICAIALAAFLGHLFSIFLQFKGGKGVATAVGVFIVIAPLALILSVAIFALIVYRFRYVSLGSLCAAAGLPILVGLLGEGDTFKTYMILALIISALVFYKHKENIKRLLNGEELKI